MARALQRRGVTPAPEDPLPIPSTLEELLHDRLDGLATTALEAARVVAMLAEPTTDLVETILGADTGLAEALEARVLELDGERLRFTHPLLASAVSARQTPARRRALHAHMAALVPSAEERARHLALATVEPDGAVAAVLEAAARSTQERGAPAASAELAEHSLRLTPVDERRDARRRVFLAADRHHATGDSGRATALLERARDEAAPGPELAEVLVQLAGIQRGRRAPEELYRRALSEASGDDSTLEATIHLRLAMMMRWGRGLETGPDHADRAVGAAMRSDDLAVRCRALAVQASWQFRAGLDLPRAQLEEALALERSLPGWPLESNDAPTEVCVHELIWAVELDRARTMLLELLDARRTRNSARGEGGTLWNLGLLEWRAGNWDEAERYAAEALELATQLGFESTDDFPTTLIAAHRGRVAEARASARRAVARGEAAGIVIEQSGNLAVLGFIELSVGDARAALEHLRRSYELRNPFMLEPGQRLELGDYLEALVAEGELAEAEEVLQIWEERAQRVDRAWALAILARCRGLWLAARGELDGAFASFDAGARRACAQHGSLPARAHAAGARANAASRQEARGRPNDARRCARPVRGSRCPPLGRADARRARADRWSSPVPQRADRGRAPDRASSSRRVARTARWRPRSTSPSTRSRPRSRASIESSACVRAASSHTFTRRTT